MASEYQLRLKDMNYNEKLKEITDKFTQEKEDLKRQLHSGVLNGHVNRFLFDFFEHYLNINSKSTNLNFLSD